MLILWLSSQGCSVLPKCVGLLRCLDLSYKEMKHPYKWDTFFRKVYNWFLPRVCFTAECYCFTFAVHADDAVEQTARLDLDGAGDFFTALQECGSSDALRFDVCIREPVSKCVSLLLMAQDWQLRLYRGRSFSLELEIYKSCSSASHCFLKGTAPEQSKKDTPVSGIVCGKCSQWLPSLCNSHWKNCTEQIQSNKQCKVSAALQCHPAGWGRPVCNQRDKQGNVGLSGFFLAVGRYERTLHWEA